MSDLEQIPEVRALRGGSGLIRIPNQLDIPVTDRVLRLIDSPCLPTPDQDQPIGRRQPGLPSCQPSSI